ncbi:MAG: efflux RND transporter periplasmic adaptor subunit [Chitinophaga sp.]
MRNSYTGKILLTLSFLVLVLAACKNENDRAAQTYTCPMHPEIVEDKPGECPICGMDLVRKDAQSEQAVDSSIAMLTKPVNDRIIASIPAISAESGARSYTAYVNGVVTYDARNQTGIASRVGGRIERLLIKYNYQPVRKGQMIMEVYSPELAAAQRELLFVAKNNGDVLAAAKQKLLLLGMQRGQIEQVLKTGEILYHVPVFSPVDGYILEKPAAGSSPAASPMPATAAGDGMGGMNGPASSPAVPTAPDATPVLLREGQYVSAGQPLFTIYRNKGLVAEFAFSPQLAAKLAKGQKLEFHPVSDGNGMQAGSIGLIEPVFRDGMNFTVARVYLQNSQLQAGQLLNAKVPVVYTGGWWLPKKAVSRLGGKSIVFRKEHNAYVPEVVKTGAEADGMIQVLSDIGAWRVASNAFYLVDSESFIKTDK